MNCQEIAALGASLRRIDQKLLKKVDYHNNTTTRIWYQGGEPYFDIFFDLKDHKIIWFQFTFRGQFLCWDQKQAEIKTGKTNELVFDDIGYYPASKIIEADQNSDADFQFFVKKILTTRAEEEIFAQAIALLDHNG